jgi:type II secretory pathway component PulJ
MRAGEGGGGAEGVAALARAYYEALEQGAPLAPFYATDAEAGDLGPVLKVGSGEGEVFRGAGAVRAEVQRVGAAFARNRLESRALQARARHDLGWFFDLVWWSGESEGAPFASLTRWTGVCLRLPGGWKLLQLHVSEGA